MNIKTHYNLKNGERIYFIPLSKNIIRVHGDCTNSHFAAYPIGNSAWYDRCVEELPYVDTFEEAQSMLDSFAVKYNLDEVKY